jgi:1-acyl-sn-glycerol-3-phosphate acyltransferase
MVNYLLNHSKYLKYAAKHVLIYLFIKQELTKKIRILHLFLGFLERNLHAIFLDEKKEKVYFGIN